MTEAPERIWAVHWNTEGAVMNGAWADTIRHFGGGVEYLRADHVDALLKAERGKVLREAQSMITMRIVQAAGGGENLLSPSDIYKGVEALISEDATDG